MAQFADVTLPLRLKVLTYAIPLRYQHSIEIGSSILVPLRNRKLFPAIVLSLHNLPPSYPVKNIAGIIYQQPICTPQQLNFTRWLSVYYLSSIGEIIAIALPKIFTSPDHITFQAHNESFSTCNEEAMLLKLLKAAPLSYATMLKKSGQATMSTTLLSLLDQEHIYPTVSTIEAFDARSNYIIPASTHDLVNYHPTSPKQRQLLAYLLDQQLHSYSTKKELLDLGYSKGALHTLLQKGKLVECAPSALPPPYFIETKPILPSLTTTQHNALNQIKKQFDHYPVVLLHGVIGSGKTVVYMHLIESFLLQQKQVLYLLPEIGLATHIVERMNPFWKKWLAIYHSKQSPKERLQVWKRVLTEKSLLIIGTRSALFLPFSGLKLIIVDEEHDPAYKQTDYAPTYHARDSSILLAKQHQAAVLLGSGTPAIESYFNATSGKYGLVTLSHRFGCTESPKLFFIDIQLGKTCRQMHDSFSTRLLSEIQTTIDQGGQVMIFHNRRGYARYFICASCGWIPHCTSCSVNLTYHQTENKLYCHYCGYIIPPSSHCQNCGSTQLHNRGFGTEKVVETLQLHFPGKRIGRMDLDSTKGKYGYHTILEQISSGALDIVVGTQMMAKGLDFSNIQLIGVLDIDGLLHFPDFRSNEKSFQLIAQLSGRAGRRNQQGRVVIQTAQPHHPLFKYLSDNDYLSMYHAELTERKKFLYPPYVKLIQLRLSCIDETLLRKGALTLKQSLHKHFGSMALGPQQPLINKIRNHFLLIFLVKIEAKQIHTLQQEKERLHTICQAALHHKIYNKIKILIDIDPI